MLKVPTTCLRLLYKCQQNEEHTVGTRGHNMSEYENGKLLCASVTRPNALLSDWCRVNSTYTSSTHNLYIKLECPTVGNLRIKLWSSEAVFGEMVVQVKPSPQLSSKAMDGNQNKVEAKVLLLGAENVGKSGERLCEWKTFFTLQSWFVNLLCFCIYSPHRAFHHEKIHRGIWRYWYVKSMCCILFVRNSRSL